MSRAAEDYLARLRTALAGADPATIQDALADAQEHLASALAQAVEKDPAIDPEAALANIIETYGTPDEVATAYKEMESMTPVAFAHPFPSAAARHKPGFFGVLGDIHAYAALLYMLTSLITGIAYFTWATTGLSLSLGLMVLIIGIPFASAFLLSVRGIALIEGRLVEAVLGERMPRRPAFFRKDLGWLGGIKALFADGTTWSSLLYMVLQMPLGILYFTVMVTFIAVSLGLMAGPIVQYVFDQPLIQTSHDNFFLPAWGMPFLAIGGFLLLVVTLHLARGVGRLHARYAKKLLVKGD